MSEHKIIRDGWVRICGEDLSEFHRDLIKSIPKYASLAVTEGMLPKDRDVLSLEERSQLSGMKIIPLSAKAVEKLGKCEDEGSNFQNALAGIPKYGLPPSTHKIPAKKKVPHTVVFGPIEVAPGCSATVQVNPECLFRGEKIISLGDGDLLIEGLFVGQRLQLPCQLPNPPIVVAAFSNASLRSGVLLDTCDKALAITWLIRNATDQPKTFHAAIEGQAIDPPVAPRGRKWVVGFPSVVVPPLSTVVVQIQPQCLFRGETIINDGDEGLEIHGLFVGNRLQLVDGAHLLLHSRFELRLDSCHPALSIAMQIHNPSNQPKKFACSIIGSAVL
jgi:hypothetical protein